MFIDNETHLLSIKNNPNFNNTIDVELNENYIRNVTQISMQPFSTGDLMRDLHEITITFIVTDEGLRSLYDNN